MFETIGYIFILLILCIMFRNQISFRSDTRLLFDQILKQLESKATPTVIHTVTAEEIMKDIQSHRISLDRQFVALEAVQEYPVLTKSQLGLVIGSNRTVPEASPASGQMKAAAPVLAPGSDSPKTIAPKSAASSFRPSITEILHDQDNDPNLYKPEDFQYHEPEKSELQEMADELVREVDTLNRSLVNSAKANKL